MSGTTPECTYIGGHARGFDAECYWCVNAKHTAYYGTSAGDPQRVDRLLPEHRDRRWRDKDGDWWSAHPTIPGAWEVAHETGFQRGRAEGVPKPEFGPYTEIISPT